MGRILYYLINVVCTVNQISSQIGDGAKNLAELRARIVTSPHSHLGATIFAYGLLVVPISLVALFDFLLTFFS